MSFNLLASECQVDDWKKGAANHCAHKWICGNLLSDDFLHEVLTESEVVKVPPPDPGFERSQALLHLISFLEQPKMIDYVVSNKIAHIYLWLSDSLVSLYVPLMKKSWS
jgi:hypothetical protein